MTSATAPVVAEICARLDGLPLAIELAAARITMLPPQALLARLSQRLAVLTSGVRDAPARQQTLRNTLDWSYHLLSTEEQRLFWQLSVFVGGCTLDAIESISSISDNRAHSVLEAVASLLDKSLLQQTEPEGEEPRFVLLETIREYGLECLGMSGEMESTREIHAEYYLGLAEAAEPALSGPQKAWWFDRLEQEHNNLRAALQWLLDRAEDSERIEKALRLSAALLLFWSEHSHVLEGRAFLEQALASSQGVAASVRAKALRAAGDMAGTMGDFERGEELCQESLVLSRAIGDTAGVGHAVHRLGAVGLLKGGFAAARSRFEESSGLAREARDQSLTAWSLQLLALVCMSQGEYAQGRSLAENSVFLPMVLQALQDYASFFPCKTMLPFPTQGIVF